MKLNSKGEIKIKNILIETGAWMLYSVACSAVILPSMCVTSEIYHKIRKHKEEKNSQKE